MKEMLKISENIGKQYWKLSKIQENNIGNQRKYRKTILEISENIGKQYWKLAKYYEENVENQ